MKNYYAFLLILFFCACVKDKPTDRNDGQTVGSGRKVWIANEGSLGNGNASLSVYDLEKDSVYHSVFYQKNHQFIGDVLQSLLIVDEQLFLAVNNSDKILVINKNDFSLVGSIAVRKPRQMLLIDEGKMYVTSLFYPEINIVDPRTFQQKGKINVDFPSSEGMLYFNGKVYVGNWDTACHYIYELDPTSNSITARIPIAGGSPTDILVDKNEKLWVLSGNVSKGMSSTFTQIDPESRSILKEYQFPYGADMIKPCWNPGRDTLYFLGVNYDGGTANNGLFQMSVSDSILSPQLLVAAQPLQYFWGLGVDPVRNQIYLADPKGFIQNGAVRIYTPQGHQIKEFSAQLGPGFFLFE